jgi:O-acetyl-ADP-ribose deacetylase (regulator of RNase III)
MNSIAFQAIPTGAFGYPVVEAAEVAFRTIIKMIPTLKYVERIKFVLYSNRELDIHTEALSRILSQEQDEI